MKHEKKKEMKMRRNIAEKAGKSFHIATRYALIIFNVVFLILFMSIDLFFQKT